MTKAPDQTIDLRHALDKHLNARPLSKSISTLLQSKRKTIDYAAYYQRNYVWDNDKATFFIESILLGIEVPPLIMFIPANNKKTYEVIDGRQRYETLKRFFEGEFKLSKKGLRNLSELQGLNFQHLNPEFQRLFFDTTIRIIEFSMIGDHSYPDELEDMIKKEIYWRFNSGIEPLKTLEVQSATHMEDEFTKIVVAEFNDDPPWLQQFKRVFFNQRASTPPTDSECQAKIRELLVLNHFPINIYAYGKNRRDTVEWLYELYIERAEDKDKILQAFIEKVKLLERIFIGLEQDQWLIYQGLYWALVVLEQNNIDIKVFVNQQAIDNLIVFINDNLNIFISDNRSFSNLINQLFQCLAKFCEQELKRQSLESVDFDNYLRNSLEGENDARQTDVKDSIHQLASMRLNRPDAVTKTIEDLVQDMAQNRFLIRPAYQRQEVININKASGIIESMLLGIPLPTIFIYRRENGVCEVVDGQQRLLSILGFIGQTYKDENNRENWSKKPHYKLFKNIRVLKELAGFKFTELPEELQDRILDFELSVVYIDETLNKAFDPIDLFIRLNNKPYPVKEHTFEMWNSYAHRDVIEAIQTITQRYETWFYYRKNNKRMDNQELLSVFAYLSFTLHKDQGLKKVFDNVSISNWAPKPLTFRLPKLLITEWLMTSTRQQDMNKRDTMLACIENVNAFIQKVEVLVRNLENIKHGDDSTLQQSLNRLLGIKNQARILNPFYILWFLLAGIDRSVIDKQAQSVAEALINFLETKQIISKVDDLSAKDIFKTNVEAFWARF
ncbi:MAG: hypothetical protein ACI8WB_003768 [Phenylobacterium sp.]|jgi:hypothetical protein